MAQTTHTLRSDLTFIGHISIDKVENMNGTKTQPGGGALYAAIAAKALNAKTAIVSAIGKDFSFADCFEGLDSTYVKKLNIPTTKYHIRYNDDWEADYLEVEPGAGARTSPSQIPLRSLQPGSIIHVSPMKPAKAAKIVSHIRHRSSDVTISMNTWMGYTKEPRERRLLMKLASQVDFFMLNEFEAKVLAQTDSLSIALQRIAAKKLIVTMGKLGAIIGGIEMEPQMVPALMIPTGKVVDTTGAGDVWNGAFLATYQTTCDTTKSVTVASVISSIKCSRWGFKAIQQLSFQKPSDVVEHVLALKEGGMQKRITDFAKARNVPPK